MSGDVDKIQLGEVMLFRAPKDKPVLIATTEGGHTAVVDPKEWTDLPSCLHRIALEAGCITDNMSSDSINYRKTQSAKNRKTEEGPNARIREILLAWKENPQPGFLTFSGKPNLTRLAKEAGFGVVRDDVMRMWSEITNTPERKDGISRKIAAVPEGVEA